MAEAPEGTNDAGTPPVEGNEAAPKVEPSERPILPGQEIVYDGGSVKVSDAVADHQRLQALGPGLEKMTPEKVQAFLQWDGAMSGDPAAVAEYARSLIPPEAPKPEVVAEDQQRTIDALRTDLEEVKKVLSGDVQPVTNQLRSVTELQSYAKAVEAQAERRPHLARLSEKRGPMVAAQAVRNRKNFYEKAAQQEGKTLASLPPEVQKEVYEKIFSDVETELADFAAVYGEPLTKKVPAPVPPVNDQGSPDQEKNFVPAKIQIGPDGRRLDGVQPPGQVQEQPPAGMIIPPTGGAPGIEPSPASQRFTLAAMSEKLKADAERIAGIV